MLKSRPLKNTTDFYEEDRLPKTIFQQSTLMMQLKTKQIFSMFSLQGDDIQDFNTRRNQALSAASEVPPENVLEGLYKMKENTRVCSASDCIGFV